MLYFVLRSNMHLVMTVRLIICSSRRHRQSKPITTHRSGIGYFGDSCVPTRSDSHKLAGLVSNRCLVWKFGCFVSCMSSVFPHLSPVNRDPP